MKKFLRILFIFPAVSIFAQIGYVEYDHPVYTYLERMKTEHIISDYNSFELPKTRKNIGKWLNEIISRKNQLSPVDRKILGDFIEEFALEAGKEPDFNSLIDNPSALKIFDDKDKYLYYYFDDKKNSFFVNLFGEFNNIYRSDIEAGENGIGKASVSIIKFGGLFRGSFYDKVGFEIKAGNGTYYGNRDLAALQGDTKYNYKFNYGPEENSGTDYFDQTAGFLTYQNDWLNLKIGRDKILLGHSIIKDILSDNSTNYDYVTFGLNYKAFSYSFIHAKLLGEMTFANDPVGGSLKEVGVKNFVYHRFGLNINDKTFIGAGETVIYTDRDIDLSYLNPFNFYKSAEHANQDRDNSMLFFDFSNYSLYRVKVFASLIIDDLDFGRFGTSWLGNITILNTGFHTTLLHAYLPLDVELQYLRIDPYAYTHRLAKNNYTNFGAPLGAFIQPNSSTLSLKLTYTPHYRIWIDFLARYSVHGGNSVDQSGNLINNGGDINFGYRKEDIPDAKFLSGPKDINRFFNLNFTFQPIKNYFVKLGLNYRNISEIAGNTVYWEGYFQLSLKI